MSWWKDVIYTDKYNDGTEQYENTIVTIASTNITYLQPNIVVIGIEMVMIDQVKHNGNQSWE